MLDDATLFRPDGDLFVPTESAGNPWGELTGGGPVAGLVAHAVQGELRDPELFVARLTVDLHRPVRRDTGIAVRTRTVREGKRLSVVEVVLSQDGAETTRALAQVLRRGDPAAGAQGGEVPFAGPEGIEDRTLLPEGLGLRFGVHDLVQVRWISDQAGGSPSRAWMRMPLPLLPGEAITPLQRAAVLVDCISAASPVRDPFGPWINSDITLYLHREPRGEWLGMEIEREVEHSGIGLARARLFDPHGPVGTAQEAVLMHQLG